MERRKVAPFKDQYDEVSIIGKGQFGSATLVWDKSTGHQYISKKIILAGLDDREKEGAYQEANLLKHLRHPNIVSYVSSLIEKNVLYI